MTKAEIMDLTKTSQNFPALVKHEIPRENILQTIKTVLDGDTEVLFVEGGPGTGKTTLLGQFARVHPMNTFSIFIKPTSRWAYDPLVLQLDLCNQLEWLLGGKELQDEEQVDDSFLRTRFLRLSKRAKYKRETYYFIVDGLEDLPREAGAIRQAVLQMLPFGFAFRFLIAGDAILYTRALHDNIARKSFPLTGFTLDETKKYFDSLSIPQDKLEEIHRICGGVPGYLSSVDRILSTGLDASALIDEMPNQLPALFDIEWRAVGELNERQLVMLAVMAHDHRHFTIEDLKRIVDLTEQAIIAIGHILAFVTIDLDSREVVFVSETFRKFAAEKLRDFRVKAQDIVIQDLLKQPDSLTSLTYLPEYFAKTGRDRELLAYLNHETLTHMLSQGQSLMSIHQKISLGLHAAERANRDAELVRFSVQNSILHVVSDTTVWRSEVEALLALDKYEAALALAQGMVSTEDRLHLLAIVAKSKQERGLTIEPELDAQIRQLCKTIDASELGEKAVEIATDLILTHPDLAIELVENSTASGENENAMDWAMVKLSLHTLNLRESDTGSADAVERIRKHISDPLAKSFSATASILLGDHTADEAIKEIEELDRASDQLYLLRQWALENREREDTWKVTEFGLQLVLKVPDYAPNARLFRELATPIPYMLDSSIVAQLIRSLDAQKAAIERAGPTEDYVRLELLLARGEKLYDRKASTNRVHETYHYIINLKDLETEVSCLARLISALHDIDPDFELEAESGIHTIAKSDLQQKVDSLLLSTASHFDAMQRVIRGLAKAKPELALEIAHKLNTEPRRDLALLEFVDSMIQVPISEVNFSFITKAINGIRDPKKKDEAIFKSIARSEAADDLTSEVIQELLPILNRIKDIQHAGMRCIACALAYKILMKLGGEDHENFADHLLRSLKNSWEAIDPEYARIEIGFDIVETLAPLSFDLASSFLETTNQFRDKILIDSTETAFAFEFCLRLTSRALRGLIQGNIENEEDLENFGQLLDSYHSCGHRALHWGDLALHYYLSGRHTECKRIVAERLKPLIRNLPNEDQYYRSSVIVQVAAALFCAHKLTAYELISELPEQRQDDAYSSICKFILRKCLPSEPYNTMPGTSHDISFEDILDIIDILQRVRKDAEVYYYLEQISLSVSYSNRKSGFSREQRHAIAEQLKKLIELKFPNPDFIKHEGYKIIGLAQIARLDTNQAPSWSELKNKIKDLDNLSDRVLILGKLASAMPRKEALERKALLDEAEGLIKQIPSTSERLERYEALAREATQVDPVIARQYLKIAIETTIGDKQKNVARERRRLIDFAHRLDPEFAASLVSLLDEERNIKHLHRHLQTLNFKKEIADSVSSKGKEQDHSPDEYASAAWTLLGSLNAGRIQAKHFDYLQPFIKVAAELPLEEAFPIYAMILENGIRRWANSTEQSVMQLRPFFQALLEASHLALTIGNRSSAVLQRAKQREMKGDSDKSLLVRGGEREKAISFIRRWFEKSLGDYLKICDPYFGPEDLEVLQLLLSTNRSLTISILTSIEHQQKKKLVEPWETAYRDHWRIHLSDQDPPDVDIAIIGLETNGRLPVHDRWWITDRGGLRLGTSFNSLGVERDSEISVMSEDEAEIRETDIDQYLLRRKREHNGVKVRSTIFSL